MTWTLAELAELAGRALAAAEVGVANARVTGAPDARMVRWYTTIGLLDRPDLGPGRVARYGPRHLWQLVAIKRLQAEGLPLAEIQHRLAGATDETLKRVAALPANPTLSGRAGSRAAGPTLSLQARVAASDMDEDDDEPPHHPHGHARLLAPSRDEKFWASRPTANRDGVAAEARLRAVVEHRLFGVRLGEATLLLPVEPGPEDWEAIVAAARPLLDVLADRGLLDRQREPDHDTSTGATAGQ